MTIVRFCRLGAGRENRGLFQVLEQLLEETLKAAAVIAGFSLPVVMMI